MRYFAAIEGGSDPRERRPSSRTPRRLALESLEGRALLSVGPTTAQVEMQAATNRSILFDIYVSVPSANGGAGKQVHITGELRLGLVDRAVDRLLDAALQSLNSLGNRTFA